uniref:Uncharacterized protein n=1 Tax=Klebsiella pneumoniae TaxID=573 RepID=A0A2P1BQ35_KLEPN|nr:hypothetical protein [Klebsiella pneumoniae]
MKGDVIPELGITQHIKASQRRVTAVMMGRQTAINRRAGQNNARRVGADSAIKPVFATDQMYPATIRHHVAALRQANKCQKPPS